MTQEEAEMIADAVQTGGEDKEILRGVKNISNRGVVLIVFDGPGEHNPVVYRGMTVFRHKETARLLREMADKFDLLAIPGALPKSN